VTARLHTEVVRELPDVPEERRAAIGAGERTAAAHARWMDELGLFDRVEAQPPPERRAEPRELRLAAWNLERGRHLPAAAGLISRAGADVALLSELDAGMARSANHHTTRALAEALGHGYVYAVEFLELGLGGPEERERHAGERNARGLHGGAITSAVPIERPAVIRLDAGGDWFDGSRGEPRVGSRIGVLGTVRAGGVDVTLASVHLESHTDPRHRAEQTQQLLEAIEAYAPGAPAVVAGDLNTLSVPTAFLSNPARLKKALEEDAERLLRPVAHEPLFERAREAGFDWRAANVLDQGTLRRVQAAGSRRVPVRLDWILTRKLGVSRPELLEAVDLATGQVLSDHDLLAATVRPPSTLRRENG